MNQAWIAWWDAHPWMYLVVLAVAGILMYVTRPRQVKYVPPPQPYNCPTCNSPMELDLNECADCRWKRIQAYVRATEPRTSAPTSDQVKKA